MAVTRITLPDGSTLVLARSAEEDDTTEGTVPAPHPPVHWKGPGQWRSYAEAVQEGEPEDDGDDDPEDLGLAAVNPYTRTRRGRVEKVRGYHSRAERQLLNGWIPQASWKEGQEKWAVRGEAIWKANEWKARPASALKPGDEAQVTHPVTGAPVTGIVRAVNHDADGTVRVDVEHPEQVPPPYQLPQTTPTKRHRREITEDEARGNSRPVSAEEFQRLAAVGNQMVDLMKRDSSPATGLDDHWEDIKHAAWKEVQKSWGGVTVDSHSGDFVPDGADEFAMTVKPASMKSMSVPEDATEDQFDAAMDQALAKFRPVLEREGYHLGVFHDDDSHRIDMDPVAVVDSPYKVEAIGAYAHSIGGAYHFKTGDGYFPPHVDAAAETQRMERSVVKVRANTPIQARSAPAEQEGLFGHILDRQAKNLPVAPKVPVAAPTGDTLTDQVNKLRAELPVETPEAWKGKLAKDSGPDAEQMRRNDVIRQAGKVLDDELQRRVAAAMPDPAAVDRHIKYYVDKLQAIEDDRLAVFRQWQSRLDELENPDAIAAGFQSMTDLINHLDVLSRAYDTLAKLPAGALRPLSIKDMTDDQVKNEITRLATVMATANYNAGEKTTALKARLDGLQARKDDIMVKLRRQQHLKPTLQHDEAVKLLQEVRGDTIGGPGLTYTGPYSLSVVKPATATEGAVLKKNFPPAPQDAEEAMRWAESNYPQPWLNYARQHGKDGGYRLVGGVTRGDYTDFSRIIRLSGGGEQYVAGAGHSGRVAVHELGHVMEASVPGLVAMEQAELWRRTSTGPVGSRVIEQPQLMQGYTDERGRADHFPSPYSGKDYAENGEKVADAYELFTTAYESVMAGSDYADTEMRQWVLGMMAMLGRGSTAAPVSQPEALVATITGLGDDARKSKTKGGEGAAFNFFSAAKNIQNGKFGDAADDLRGAAGRASPRWSVKYNQLADQVEGMGRPAAEAEPLALKTGDRVTDGKRHGTITDIRPAASTLGHRDSASVMWDGGKRKAPIWLDKLQPEGKTLGDAAPLPWTTDAATGEVHFTDNLGKDRSEMPQLTSNGQYSSDEIRQMFAQRLMAKGIRVDAERVPPDSLRATQNDGTASAVRGIADAMKSGKMKPKAIYVSRDNRIFDGHHTWAGQLLADRESGTSPGLLIERVDLPMDQLLAEGDAFDTEMGIPKRGVGDHPVPPSPDALDQVKPLTGADSLTKYTGPDGKIVPERAALHRQIVERLLAGHKPQAHLVATFFGGGPASGKSSLTAAGPDSVEIDADAIKAMMPEWKPMVAAGNPEVAAYLHEESSMISKEAMTEAEHRHLNFTLDGTGDSSYAKMARKVQHARDAGYEVHGRYVTVDTDTAVQRAKLRAEHTGRMVPESVIRDIHKGVSEVFPETLRNGLWDGAELYDNNGKAPVKVLEYKAGQPVHILDVAAWQRFLAKAGPGGKIPYTGSTEVQARAAEKGSAQ